MPKVTFQAADAATVGLALKDAAEKSRADGFYGTAAYQFRLAAEAWAASGFFESAALCRQGEAEANRSLARRRAEEAKLFG